MTARRRPLRRAGAKWRILVHEWVGGAGPRYGMSHSVASDERFGGHVQNCEEWRNHTLPYTELDEIVVGRWLHLEQQDAGRWWLNVGGVTLHIRADCDGKPLAVSVHGPGCHSLPVEGCTYELEWGGES